MPYRVQRGTLTFGASSLSASAVLSACVPSRSFPRLNNLRWLGSGRDVAADVTLAVKDLGAVLTWSDGLSLPMERNAAAEMVDHRYHWEVVEDRLPEYLHAQDGFETLFSAHIRLNAGQLTNPMPPQFAGDLSRVCYWPMSMRSDGTGQEGAALRVLGFIDEDGFVRLERGDAAVTGNTGVVALRMGSAWRVRRVQGTVGATGVDVALEGCGPEPWTEKLYVASWKVPPAANDMQDVPFVRRDPANPDRLLLRVFAFAQAGTYTVSAYVLWHERLHVLHTDSISRSLPDLGPGTDVDVSLPGALDSPMSETSLLVHGDGRGGAEYPRQCWGYGLDAGGTFASFRRGRQGGIRFPWYALQAIQWPADLEPGGEGSVSRKEPLWRAQTLEPLWRVG